MCCRIHEEVPGMLGVGSDITKGERWKPKYDLQGGEWGGGHVWSAGKVREELPAGVPVSAKQQRRAFGAESI